LNDLKLTNIAGDTQVDLPAARRLAIQERVTTGEIRGDDKLMEVVSISDALEWELESGGISLDAYALMTGRTATETGTTPSRTNTLTLSGAECFPYFKIYGKSLGEDCTGDVHAKLWKCKLTEPIQGTFQEGQFWVTQCRGIAIDDGSNGMMDFVQNETAASLPSS